MNRFSLAVASKGLEGHAATLCGAPDLVAAVHSTTVPVLVHDGSHILHANKSCTRWLGYADRDVLEGADLRVLAEEDDHKALSAALGARLAKLPTGPHIQRFLHMNGDPLIASVLVRAARLDGTPVLLALLDPTSATQRGSNLLRLLEEAVDHLHDIVFITEAEPIDDVGRRIVFVNRIFTLITGYESNEVLGKTPSMTIGELTDRKALSRIERGLKQKRAVHEELLKYGKHGDEYWVELDILPVYAENGEHTHWVSVQRDITERKLLQQRLVENERLATAGLLAAKLGEEVSAPLASSRASLDWLVKELPGLMAGSASAAQIASVMAALRGIRTNTLAVADTTAQLRLLGARKGPSVELVATDVSEVLEQALALVQVARRVPARVQRVYENVSKVMADPARLLHVFHFALENAAKTLLEERSAQNTIVLRVRAVVDGVLVVVQGTGVRGTSEIADHLFTPFANRRSDSKEQGVALFVANCLVGELGGRVEARECADGGTVLEVFLPVVPAFADQVLSPAL
ncbi:MAG TPA: PAS domain S-box protein [Polyangiaceae bacterium]